MFQGKVANAGSERASLKLDCSNPQPTVPDARPYTLNATYKGR